MGRQLVSTRVDGMEASLLAADDRGLAYGDGLFETLRVINGVVPLWSRHMRRLGEGCERLRIPMPDVDALLADVAAVTANLPDAVARITVTRGSGPRGYAASAVPVPRRVVTASAFLPPDETMIRDGIALFPCQTRLAMQPALAGIKHLNRLEQVLARAEWSDVAFADGLVMDTAGRVASAISANIFIVLNGQVMTPRVDQCGVAGIGRSLVLEWFADAREAELSPGMLAAASEVFISSAVRGMLAVCAIGTGRWYPGPVLRACQQHWRAHILQETP